MVEMSAEEKERAGWILGELRESVRVLRRQLADAVAEREYWKVRCGEMVARQDES